MHPEGRLRRGRTLRLVGAGIGIGACLLLDGTFPKRPEAAPQRRLSTLERLALPRLAAVRADVERLASERRDLPPQPGLHDFRVIFHAHAGDSIHTGGTLPEMLEGARMAGVHAIFLSDHFRPPRDFMDSWRGLHEGVLFIPGSEARGFLLHPASSVMPAMEGPPSRLLAQVHADDGLAFLSHIEERADHAMDQLDGMEIYNRHWDAKRDRVTLIALALKLTDPEEVSHLAEALRRFPHETLSAQIDYPEDYLEKWDTETPRRRLTGIAANDAHHNQVFMVKMVDADTVALGTAVDPEDRWQRVSARLRPAVRRLMEGRTPGDVLVRLDFDPYDRSFRSVSTHVLAPALTEAALRRAVRDGQAYVSHDWMADPTGFRFVVRNRQGAIQAIVGGEMPVRDAAEIEVASPVPCSRVRLLRDGHQIDMGRGRTLRHRVLEPGVYRAEAWLSLDHEERLWVLTNPVYLRPRPPAGAR